MSGLEEKNSIKMILKIFQKLEGSDHLNSSSQGKLLFHVTVFNMEDQLTDFGLQTEQRWIWEVHSSHIDGRYLAEL